MNTGNFDKEPNLRPLDEMPRCSVVRVDGREGVMRLATSGDTHCQIYFFGEKKLEQLDWDRLAELVRPGKVETHLWVAQ